MMWWRSKYNSYQLCKPRTAFSGQGGTIENKRADMLSHVPLADGYVRQPVIPNATSGSVLGDGSKEWHDASVILERLERLVHRAADDLASDSDGRTGMSWIASSELADYQKLIALVKLTIQTKNWSMLDIVKAILRSEAWEVLDGIEL